MAQVTRWQLVQIARQFGDASPASVVQEALPLAGRTNPDHPGVGRVALAFDEPVALEPEDEARHRRRRDLLGARQLTNRNGAAEDHDR